MTWRERLNEFLSELFGPHPDQTEGMGLEPPPFHKPNYARQPEGFEEIIKPGGNKKSDEES